jgi:hypothetical protein
MGWEFGESLVEFRTFEISPGSLHSATRSAKLGPAYGGQARKKKPGRFGPLEDRGRRDDRVGEEKSKPAPLNTTRVRHPNNPRAPAGTPASEGGRYKSEKIAFRE